MKKKKDVAIQFLLKTQNLKKIAPFQNKPQWESGLVSIQLVSKSRPQMYLQYTTIHQPQLVVPSHTFVCIWLPHTYLHVKHQLTKEESLTTGTIKSNEGS